ncbi:MAG: thioredoxin domain-containing protein [Synergistaceae bacterium]|nr:thioredoxin domain-containing protein [Synergistaceae bacterium]
MGSKKSNRLAEEKSPYLLQHAHNPVDWYPWGEAAFERAKEEDKPIFLSIGYSSCHWCHVMEKECFDDEEVAGLLNDTCVSIKVDREERPDLDALFMEICHIQNGNGGWPLNLFLTPEGEPFFAATFLPKRTIGRMPGLADVTPRVKWLWLTQKEDVLRGAKLLVETLAARTAFVSGGQVGLLQARMAVKELKDIFDEVGGGFGFAPKFPCAPRLLFLLEYAQNTSGPERDEVFSMVDLTLRKMWAGGIHDHLGGGYARYATDERWVVPHFEKMLYDQAMLLWVAAGAHEIKADDFYLKFAEDIVGCILRDFASPESCFWTSLDADSEGDEGKFYRWTEEEIRKTLPQGDAGIFCAAYAVLPAGNFMHEMTGMQMGYNVLYEAATYTELARRYGLRGPELVKRLENDRRILLEARNKRPKPRVDDKVLMDWNGLTIGALARAGRVFGKKEWILSAERAALYLQKVLVDPKGAWRRRYRAKEAAIAALPGDYAALMWGVMELYESADMEKQKIEKHKTDKQRKDWLRYAANLATKLEENFWDEPGGGFFLSPADEAHVFLRRKTAVDDAVPSANALAMMAYVALAKGDPENQKYPETAKAIGSCFTRAVNLHPVECLSIITASMKLKNLKGEHGTADEKNVL